MRLSLVELFLWQWEHISYNSEDTSLTIGRTHLFTSYNSEDTSFTIVRTHLLQQRGHISYNSEDTSLTTVKTHILQLRTHLIQLRIHVLLPTTKDTHIDSCYTEATHTLPPAVSWLHLTSCSNVTTPYFLQYRDYTLPPAVSWLHLTSCSRVSWRKWAGYQSPGWTSPQSAQSGLQNNHECQLKVTCYVHISKPIDNTNDIIQVFN